MLLRIPQVPSVEIKSFHKALVTEFQPIAVRYSRFVIAGITTSRYGHRTYKSAYR